MRTLGAAGTGGAGTYSVVVTGLLSLAASLAKKAYPIVTGP